MRTSYTLLRLGKNVATMVDSELIMKIISHQISRQRSTILFANDQVINTSSNNAKANQLIEIINSKLIL